MQRSSVRRSSGTDPLSISRTGGTGPRNADPLELALLSHPHIDDCVVLSRNLNGTAERIAYIVGDQTLTGVEIENWLKNRTGETPTCNTVVPISALPLTEDGLLDSRALEHITVPDPALLTRLEAALKQQGKVKDAAVLAVNATVEEQGLHFSELLNRYHEQWAKAQTVEHAATPEKTQAPESKSPALAHGTPIDQTQLPRDLTEVLFRAATQFAQHELIYIQPGASVIRETYADLLTSARRIQAGLSLEGLKAGDTVLFQLDQNQDFVAAFWGCILAGVVVIPVSIPPNYDTMTNQTKKLHGAWDMLGKPPVICSTSTRLGLRMPPIRAVMPDLHLLVVDDLLTCEQAPTQHQPAPTDPAMLLMTSGSTGMPKLVIQTHQNLIARCEATRLTNAFTPDDISLNWLPLDHVGGIVMFHMRDLFTGATQIQVPTENILQDPLTWLRHMDAYGVTATWAPNFAYALVTNRLEELADPTLRFDLSRLRFILNAGEAIVSRQARKFMQVLAEHGLRDSAMHPAWGMSETCSAVTFNKKWRLDTTDDSDPHVVVGHAVPGFSMRIADAENNVLPEGRPGRLQVKGASVLPGYHLNDEANQQSFTADGWFDTGDQATIVNGAMTITGRMKDVIIINGLNFSSHEIEASVEELHVVASSFTAAVGIHAKNDTTDELVIFFVPSEKGREDIDRTIAQIRAQVVADHGVNPNFLISMTEDEIPKTAIGKIQRAQLKQRFESGLYRERAKTRDKHHQLPAWFFEQTWIRREFALLAEPNPKGVTLVLADNQGLAEKTAAANPDRTYLFARPGDAFAQTGPRDYRIRPNTAADYDTLLETAAGHGPVDQVLHLWTLDDKPGEIEDVQTLDLAQEKGLLSLLLTAKSLKKCPRRAPSVRLVFTTLDAVGIGVNPPRIQHATVPGYLKTIHAEMPWLTTHHVDLETGCVRNPEFLVRELRVVNAAPDVVYRDGKRLRAALEPADLGYKPIHAAPLEKNGLYLITGGLGGIARHVAGFLAKNFKARLLLVGRSPRAEQGEHTAFIQRLEAMGAKVHYAAADVTNETAVRKVVAEAEATHGRPLNGIFHLAGVLTEGMIANTEPDQLLAALGTKMNGSWILNRILEERENTIFVNFSSVNGWFGGANAGAYAAGNSFQDLFTAYQQARGKVKSYCFAWSIWDETGMSLGFGDKKEMALSRGFRTMSPGRALYSMVAALCHDEPHLFIGLDGNNPHIREFLPMPSRPLTVLKAITSGEQALDDETRANTVVPDRFGTPTRCESVRHVACFPYDAAGQPDQTALLQLLQPTQAPTERVSADDTERVLTDIWCEVLDLPEVSRDENFFELGGHSLLMAKVRTQIKNRLNQEPTVVDLFRYPTIAGLSSFLQENEAPDTTVADAIAEIWTNLLDLPELDPHANFFDLGGHSLLMGQVRQQIRERLDLDLAMVQLFRHPTAHMLEEFIHAKMLHGDNSDRFRDWIEALWREALEMAEAIDPEANFFDLGGHSLLMGRIQKRIRDEYNLDLTMVELFRHPTISSLAKLVAAREKEISPSAENPAPAAKPAQQSARDKRQRMMRMAKRRDGAG